MSKEFKEYVVREYPDRLEFRNKEGKLHRENGEPAVVYKKRRNVRFYFENGELHRINGPAFIYDELEYFFFLGKEYNSLNELTLTGEN